MGRPDIGYDRSLRVQRKVKGGGVTGDDERGAFDKGNRFVQSQAVTQIQNPFGLGIASKNSAVSLRSKLPCPIRMSFGDPSRSKSKVNNRA